MKQTLGRAVLAWAGYGTFFMFCFALFAYWSCPYDRVRDYLIQEATRPPEKKAGRTSKPPPQLSIGELGPYWVSGVEMQDVALTLPAEAEGAPTRFEFDAVYAHLSPLSLLLGEIDLDFEAVVGVGEVEGNYSQAGEAKQVSAELTDVELASVGLGSLAGLPVKGRISGAVDLDLPEDLAQSEGDVDLQVDGLTIGDGKAKVKIPGMGAGMTVDQVKAGDLSLQLAVKDGLADVKKLETNGEDLKLSGSGNLKLATPLSRSKVDASVELRFSDGYKKKSPRTKAIFDLMNINPQMKRAVTPDGSLRYALGGTVQKLRPRPAGSDRGRARKGRPKKPRPKPRAAP